MDLELEIEVAQNGFILKYRDPDVVASNRNSDSKTPWMDPCKRLVYPDAGALVSALTKILPAVQAHANDAEPQPEQSFGDLLQEALNDADDDDD